MQRRWKYRTFGGKNGILIVCNFKLLRKMMIIIHMFAYIIETHLSMMELRFLVEVVIFFVFIVAFALFYCDNGNGAEEV